MKNNQTEMYPYAYVYKGKKTILVWQTGENIQDSFKLDPKNYLISAQTEKGLKKYLVVNQKGYIGRNLLK